MFLFKTIKIIFDCEILKKGGHLPFLHPLATPLGEFLL